MQRLGSPKSQGDPPQHPFCRCCRCLCRCHLSPTPAAKIVSPSVRSLRHAIAFFGRGIAYFDAQPTTTTSDRVDSISIHLEHIHAFHSYHSHHTFNSPATSLLLQSTPSPCSQLLPWPISTPLCQTPFATDTDTDNRPTGTPTPNLLSGRVLAQRHRQRQRSRPYHFAIDIMTSTPSASLSPSISLSLPHS
jgi:hypothetical protein